MVQIEGSAILLEQKYCARQYMTSVHCSCCKVKLTIPWSKSGWSHHNLRLHVNLTKLFLTQKVSSKTTSVLRSNKTMSQRSIQALMASHTVDLPSYAELYKYLHLHPELSNQEKETSETCATHLARLGGFEIHTHIGGYGLAGVLRNGPGQTILIRGEMDALPVLEQTGLSYSSTMMAVDSSGSKQPVMHACGHDSPSIFL